MGLYVNIRYLPTSMGQSAANVTVTKKAQIMRNLKIPRHYDTWLYISPHSPSLSLSPYLPHGCYTYQWRCKQQHSVPTRKKACSLFSSQAGPEDLAARNHGAAALPNCTIQWSPLSLGSQRHTILPAQPLSLHLPVVFSTKRETHHEAHYHYTCAASSIARALRGKWRRRNEIRKIWLGSGVSERVRY